MKEIIEKIQAECQAFIDDANKKPSKASLRRMRRNTLAIGRLGKEFRRISIEEEKNL